MAHALNPKTVLFSRIQVPPSLLRRKDVAAQRRATQAIRKYGQQRPLIIDPNFQLLADVASYLALKALNYEVVKVLTLAKPSPVAIRAVGRVLDCGAALSRQVAEFNSALTFLSGKSVEMAGNNLIFEIVPIVISRTGELSIQIAPTLLSDSGRRTRWRV